jgi:hypothetical protein
MFAGFPEFHQFRRIDFPVFSERDNKKCKGAAGGDGNVFYIAVIVYRGQIIVFGIVMVTAARCK